MPIAFDSVTQVATQAWQYAWTATTGPYRVFVAGEQRAMTDETSLRIEAAGATDEPPIVEVLDANDTGDAVQIANPSRRTIQWRGSEDAADYIVEEYSGGAWVPRATILESSHGYYSYRTSELTDATTAQWRVKARDAKTNESAALTYEIFPATMPDAPAIALSYSAGTGLVTVAAA